MHQEEDEQKAINDDVPVIEQVQAHLDEHGDARFVIANLHQMDRSAHQNDEVRAYTGNITKVDEPIVAFWDWVQQDERYADDTVLVVVADHGRHRYEEGYTDATGGLDYKHHSDQCVGCRQIPMLMIGPGVLEGAVVTEPYNLEDLGHTAGWLLGLDMPWAEGQVICEALQAPPASNGRLGEVLPSRSGDLLAVQAWGAAPSAKSRIEVEGAVLSRGGAVHAEAPVAWSSGERDVVCFRELEIDPAATFDTVDHWEWQGRCVSRTGGGGTWSELSFPDDAVDPFWRPALATGGDGALWLAYADSPMANWEGIYQDLRLLRWTAEDGWQGADQGETEVYLPLDPALAIVDDTAFVAVATSDKEESQATARDGRHNRHIRVYTVGTATPEDQAWALSLQVDSTWHDAGAPFARMERPALVAVDGAVHLAFVAYSPEGSPLLVRATASPSGAGDGSWSWSEPEVVDSSGTLAGIQGPVFSETGTLGWARLVGGAVHTCTLAPEDSGGTVGEEACEETAASAVRGLTFDGETLTAGLRVGAGVWAVEAP